jgi:hypothetical protein
MSVEWAHDDAWKEVPTMRNIFPHVPSAAVERGGAAACAMGTSLPGGAVGTFARMTDVFLTKPPSKLPVVKTAQPIFHDNYTTRISAAGSGASGSPPTWDPV